MPRRALNPQGRQRFREHHAFPAKQLFCRKISREMRRQPATEGWPVVVSRAMLVIRPSRVIQKRGQLYGNKQVGVCV